MELRGLGKGNTNVTWASKKRAPASAAVIPGGALEPLTGEP